MSNLERLKQRLEESLEKHKNRLLKTRHKKAKGLIDGKATKSTNYTGEESKKIDTAKNEITNSGRVKRVTTERNKNSEIYDVNNLKGRLIERSGSPKAPQVRGKKESNIMPSGPLKDKLYWKGNSSRRVIRESRGTYFVGGKTNRDVAKGGGPDPSEANHAVGEEEERAFEERALEERTLEEHSREEGDFDGVSKEIRDNLNDLFRHFINCKINNLYVINGDRGKLPRGEFAEEGRGVMMIPGVGASEEVQEGVIGEVVGEKNEMGAAFPDDDEVGCENHARGEAVEGLYSRLCHVKGSQSNVNGEGDAYGVSRKGDTSKETQLIGANIGRGGKNATMVAEGKEKNASMMTDGKEKNATMMADGKEKNASIMANGRVTPSSESVGADIESGRYNSTFVKLMQIKKKIKKKIKKFEDEGKGLLCTDERTVCNSDASNEERDLPIRDLSTFTDGNVSSAKGFNHWGVVRVDSSVASAASTNQEASSTGESIELFTTQKNIFVCNYYTKNSRRKEQAKCYICSFPIRNSEEEFVLKKKKKDSHVGRMEKGEVYKQKGEAYKQKECTSKRSLRKAGDEDGDEARDEAGDEAGDEAEADLLYRRNRCEVSHPAQGEGVAPRDVDRFSEAYNTWVYKERISASAEREGASIGSGIGIVNERTRDRKPKTIYWKISEGDTFNFPVEGGCGEVPQVRAVLQVRPAERHQKFGTEGGINRSRAASNGAFLKKVLRMKIEAMRREKGNRREEAESRKVMPPVSLAQIEHNAHNVPNEERDRLSEYGQRGRGTPGEAKQMNSGGGEGWVRDELSVQMGGTLSRGTLNGSALNMGTPNMGTLNRGTHNRGPLNRGTLNRGPLNRGPLSSDPPSRVERDAPREMAPPVGSPHVQSCSVRSVSTLERIPSSGNTHRKYSPRSGLTRKAPARLRRVCPDGVDKEEEEDDDKDDDADDDDDYKAEVQRFNESYYCNLKRIKSDDVYPNSEEPISTSEKRSLMEAYLQDLRRKKEEDRKGIDYKLRYNIEFFKFAQLICQDKNFCSNYLGQMGSNMVANGDDIDRIAFSIVKLFNSR
ncbi:hypothetical protein PCYB_061340 [Plasmodium cynomolgi strain B]|uniref:Uncharacterized protein n=1 Tax=Plasmodium cynomolgi (strain B) TaxID=1120755 RepID=K6V8C6_PLACD|nr:hypothetical protein PCYB_061340 [Plasmodium cynomolgi strain B]GAB65402.1 hypothetical protein PCYB_061340 [Plasmodium cynomolgi strain B]